MYKVFVNEKALIFTANREYSEPGKRLEILPFDSVDTFPHALRLLDHYPDLDGLVICYPDVKKVWKKFKRDYRYIKAAGGLVVNQKGEYLFIFRNGRWDLPKGKREPGETARVSGIREVEEECGITGLWIVEKLRPTYHTYEHRGVNMLKKTAWFRMHTDFNGTLVPQQEEGITDVRWIAPEDLNQVWVNTFASVRELTKAVIDLPQ